MAKPRHGLAVQGTRTSRRRDRDKRTRVVESSSGSDLREHQEPGEKPLSGKKRLYLQLAQQDNRRRRQRYEMEIEISKAAGACLYCGAQPCGHLWVGEKDNEDSGHCCQDCTHDAMPGWYHTHTIHYEGSSYRVMGVWGTESVTEGAVSMVYFRGDGVVNWTLGSDGYKRHLGKVAEGAVVFTLEEIEQRRQDDEEEEELQYAGVEVIDGEDDDGDEDEDEDEDDEEAYDDDDE